MKHPRNALDLVSCILAILLTSCQGSVPTNEPPTVTLKATPDVGLAPLHVTFSAVARDPNGDKLTYFWEVWEEADVSRFIWNETYTRTFYVSGPHRAVITVSDGEYQAVAFVNVWVTDPPPSVP